MRLRSLVIALLLLLGGAAVAHAQDATLDRVQNMVSAGRFTEARNTLEQWERTHGDPTSNATSDDRARALFLRGALSSDPQEAEDAFVGVVLSYPSSPVAPEALLRLGQSLLTAGDARRAVTYLERLRDDYPSAPQRETGALWLARAQLALGSTDAACTTAREGVDATANANLRMLIEIERDRACAAAGSPVAETRSSAPVTPARPAPSQPADATPQTASPPAGENAPQLQTRPAGENAPQTQSRPAGENTQSPPAPPRVLNDMRVATDDAPPPASARDTSTRETTAPEPPARGSGMRVTPMGPRPVRDGGVAPPPPRNSAEQPPAATVLNGDYAVQIAAFRVQQSAHTIVEELRARGFQARMVTLDGSDLFRVRFGAFTSARDAEAAALAIRDAGFAALIVNDVRAERRQ